jgi:hypothetical protein
MKHFIIPDTQVVPGSPTDHLRWAGEYAVKHKPDVIVHIGDHWDMPSLSSYDKGKKSFEGRRYLADIEAGKKAMKAFLKPIRDEQKRLRKNKKTVWKPRLVFCIGNHENRIVRAVEDSPELEGLMSFDDFGLEGMGWEVIPFLEVEVIDGVGYSHYFTSGVMGRPVSSARAMVTKKMMSCVMGHVQDRDIAYARRGDGVQVTGLFAGIFYVGDQGYLTPQTNASWRGVWMLNEVDDGSFDELPISLNYLQKKYGGSA